MSKILIVEDEEAIADLEKDYLELSGFQVEVANDGETGLQKALKEDYDMFILDLMLPGVDGFDICRQVRDVKNTPIIMVSAKKDDIDKIRGLGLGADDYIAKPFEVTEVTMRVTNHLKIYEMQQELEMSNRRLHSVISSQARRIEDEQRNILYALAALTEDRDAQTDHHMEHVAYNCRMLAQGLQFSPEFDEEISEAFIENIEVASRLHDIGKIQVPDDGLMEPLYFREEALQDPKNHAQQGAQILERIYESTPENSFLPMAIEIARYHHAHWDGSGYPQGIAGKNIPLAARIAMVADVYDTLIGSPEGGQRRDPKASLAVIQEKSGSFFDPDIVKVFQKIKRQLRHS